MSLLFHMLSRFVIVFLSRSKHLKLTAAGCSDFEAKLIKSVTISNFFSFFHKGMGPDALILVFECCILSQLFQSPLSLSSFIKRLFSFSMPSAIRMVSSAYRRLLIFLPAILTPGYFF